MRICSVRSTLFARRFAYRAFHYRSAVHNQAFFCAVFSMPIIFAGYMAYQQKLFLKLRDHDAQIAEHVSQAYDTMYKKNYVETDAPRYFHDIRHISRVTYYVKVLYHLYRANDFTREIFSEDDLRLLQIAAIFHDAGRQADGKDYWDKESATLFYQHCVNHLHVDAARAQMFAEAILNKDFQPDPSRLSPVEKSYWKMKRFGDVIKWDCIADYPGEKTLAQRILHDADCIDIQRIGGLSFCKEYLDIDHFGSEQTESLVAEVKQLIEIQGDPYELTVFNDGTCYRQTKELIENNRDKFPLLYGAHRDDYCVAPKYSTLRF